MYALIRHVCSSYLILCVIFTQLLIRPEVYQDQKQIYLLLFIFFISVFMWSSFLFFPLLLINFVLFNIWANIEINTYWFFGNILVSILGFYCQHQERMGQNYIQFLKITSSPMNIKQNTSITLKIKYHRLVLLYSCVLVILFLFLISQRDLGVIHSEIMMMKSFKNQMLLIQYFGEELALFLVAISILLFKLIVFPSSNVLKPLKLSAWQIGIYLLLASLFVYLSILANP